MAITYTHHVVHSGAETITDQLSGTALERAGPKGRVWASFAGTDASATTGYLRGRRSGNNVIPEGSHPVQDIAGHGRIVYFANVTPGEELALELVATGAAEVSVMVKTE